MTWRRATAVLVLGAALLAASAATGAGTHGWLAVQFDPAGGPITRMDATSGATRVLAGGVRAQALAWSRDGTKLLYTQFLDNDSKLAAVDANGRPLPVHVPHASFGTFAPDGKSVVYEQLCKTLLCIAGSALDGSGLHTLVKCPKACLLYDPAWSPDGKTLAYVKQRDYHQGSDIVRTTMTVRLRNDDGSGDHALVAEGTPCDSQGAPVFSPDGTRIAFVCDVAGTYVVGADGRNLHRVSAGTVFAWSPDGRSIAYSTEGTDPRAGSVRIIDLKTGKTRAIARGRHAYSLAWHR